MAETGSSSELTKKIIGVAIEVHRHLGPGLLESVYESCLEYELKALGLEVDRQKKISLKYKELDFQQGFRIDLLVENQVVIEVKSVESLSSVHEAQILSYMKLSNCKIGLLLNFNVKLLKQGIRRFVL